MAWVSFVGPAVLGMPLEQLLKVEADHSLYSLVQLCGHPQSPAPYIAPLSSSGAPYACSSCTIIGGGKHKI